LSNEVKLILNRLDFETITMKKTHKELAKDMSEFGKHLHFGLVLYSGEQASRWQYKAIALTLAEYCGFFVEFL